MNVVRRADEGDILNDGKSMNSLLIIEVLLIIFAPAPSCLPFFCTILSLRMFKPKTSSLWIKSDGAECEQL